MQDFATIDFELANNERSSVYSVSLVIVRCRGDSGRLWKIVDVLIVKATREKCKKQFFGLQIAFNNLREYSCSAEDALYQIQLFL